MIVKQTVALSVVLLLSGTMQAMQIFRQGIQQTAYHKHMMVPVLDKFSQKYCVTQTPASSDKEVADGNLFKKKLFNDLLMQEQGLRQELKLQKSSTDFNVGLAILGLSGSMAALFTGYMPLGLGLAVGSYMALDSSCDQDCVSRTENKIKVTEQQIELMKKLIHTADPSNLSADSLPSK